MYNYMTSRTRRLLSYLGIPGDIYVTFDQEVARVFLVVSSLKFLSVQLLNRTEQ